MNTAITEKMWGEVSPVSAGEAGKAFEVLDQQKDEKNTLTPLFDRLEKNNQNLLVDLEEERSFEEFVKVFENQDLTELSLRTAKVLRVVSEILDGFRIEKMDAFGLLVEQILDRDVLETQKEAAFLDLYDELIELCDYLAKDFLEALDAKERIDVFIIRDDILECESADIEEMAAFVELGEPAAEEFMKLLSGALQLFIDLYEY